MPAFQYVLLNISGMILTPMIIGNTCGLSIGQIEYFIFASMLVGAVSTVIQVRRVGKVGSGYLMILGPSGAFISCSISAVMMGGYPLLGTMTLLSAPIEGLILLGKIASHVVHDRIADQHYVQFRV